MFGLKRNILGFFALYSLHGNVMSEDIFSCPGSLGQNSTKQELVNPVDGWDAKQEFAGHALREGGVYETLSSGALQSVWGEDDPTENGSSLVVNYLVRVESLNDPWLGCEYFSTSIVLKKRIPTKYKKCFKRMKRNDVKSPYAFENVYCKE